MTATLDYTNWTIETLKAELAAVEAAIEHKRRINQAH